MADHRRVKSRGYDGDIPYEKARFDAVVDVFSSYCVDENGLGKFLNDVERVLKPGGRFFSYTPSKASDAFRNPGTARFIDKSTLEGIHRAGAPYVGSLYPFRFISQSEYRAALLSRNLEVTYSETVGRTYQNGTEYFEFVVIAAQKT